jgi:hypothetical protein
MSDPDLSQVLLRTWRRPAAPCSRSAAAWSSRQRSSGVARWRRGDLEPLSQCRNDPCQVGGARAQLSIQRVRVELVQVGSENFNKKG